MKAIILSDVHLNVAADGRERMSEFAAFLRRIDPEKTRRLVILGDLFDFWFEYRHVIFSDYFDVLRAFARLRDAGTEIYFICGNHDFWAGRFLEKHLGFSIHRESLTLDFADKRVLFVHGDGINPRDVGYRIYKRIARAPFVVWMFGLLHPDWAMALAQGVSRGSRRLKGTDDPSMGSEVAPLREFARQALAQGQADVVMCGHSHYPVREEFPAPEGTGLYINTGDWMFHRSFVEWDGADFLLHSTGAEAAREPVPACGAERPVQ
ncbi:MAG: UDP-2,3-diacylglucosamine diphosphatase [Candidatus Hydrogenedentes bacterium]|nr:UDP-2,3-diacylglucosamine diphosphatase [Candidatus Hydrogenedentota bacterium]